MSAESGKRRKSRNSRQPDTSDEIAAAPNGSFSSTWRVWLTVCLQFVLALAIYRTAEHYRVMDADEGHFLSAVRQVYLGKAPCQDFFYQQTPLFPYPYAASMWLFGYGYEACIWVSVICGAGLATVMGSYFRERFRDRSGSLLMSWVGWYLVIVNAQILFWTPTVKNHALPLFCGAVAIYAAAKSVNSARRALLWGIVCGFTAIVCIGSRLPAAPLSGLALLWLVSGLLPGRWRRPFAGSRGFGFVLGAVPPLLLALRSVFPDTWVFHFDIIGFHEIRSGARGTYGTWESISTECWIMLQQIQFPAMLLAAFAGLFFAFRSRSAAAAARNDRVGDPSPWALDSSGMVPELMTLLCGLTAIGTVLLPRDTFHQYFMVPLVLLLMAGAPLWHAMIEGAQRLPKSGAVRGANPNAEQRRRFVRPVAMVLLLAYGFMWLPVMPHTDYSRLMFANHGEHIYQECWSRSNVERMAAEMAARTKPDDLVFSTWQGFTFFANRDDIPGNENFNARTIANKVTAEQRKRLHVASDFELLQILRTGEPTAVVSGFFCGPSRALPFYQPQIYRNPRGQDYAPNPALMKYYAFVNVPDQQYHMLWIRK